MAEVRFDKNDSCDLHHGPAQLLEHSWEFHIHGQEMWHYCSYITREKPKV